VPEGERQTEPLQACFDLVAGTSTGLIAPHPQASVIGISRAAYGTATTPQV
jgi:hypothetical protein